MGSSPIPTKHILNVALKGEVRRRERGLLGKKVEGGGRDCHVKSLLQDREAEEEAAAESLLPPLFFSCGRQSTVSLLQYIKGERVTLWGKSPSSFPPLPRFSIVPVLFPLHSAGVFVKRGGGKEKRDGFTYAKSSLSRTAGNRDATSSFSSSSLLPAEIVLASRGDGRRKEGR